MHYLYRYICILNDFIYVYGQLSAIKNLLITRSIIYNSFSGANEKKKSKSQSGVVLCVR